MMKKYNFEFKRRATILRNIEKEKYLQLILPLIYAFYDALLQLVQVSLSLSL